MIPETRIFVGLTFWLIGTVLYPQADAENLNDMSKKLADIKPN